MVFGPRGMYYLASKFFLPTGHGGEAESHETFVANFVDLDLDFDKEIEVLESEAVLNPEDWPNFIDRARRKSIKLVLRRKR